MFKALVRAPELTPELRLVQAISEFAAVLPESDRASFKVLQQTPAPSATDVIRITEEINRDGLRIHRGWQHQGTRLVGILDRIQLFSQAGDILIGGAQNIVASGVWAVFRVSLQLATGYLGFFDKASTFFMHVGKASAIQQELVLLYPDDKDLQRLMAEYLIVLIQACMHIALISKQGTLGRLFASSDKEFQRFEADLERWTRLVNRRVTLLLAKTNSKNQTLILATADESAKRAEEESRFRLMTLLSPHQLDFDITWRRERKKGVAKWIFEEASYEAWKRSDTSSVLWISGPIGSGKTVLMANLVGDLHAGNAYQDCPFVASFFCDYAKNKSLLARNIIGSLAWQLVKPHLAVKDDLATNIFDQVELLSDGDTDDVIQFLLSSLQTDRRYYAVVDSLDDCATTEIDNVVLALKRLSQSVPLNVCLSGRKDSVLQKVALTHLQVTHSISMSNEKRTREIAEFIATEITRRNSLGTIEVEFQTLIKETLTAAADGMYLWASLQIDALFPPFSERMMSDSDILEALRSLPRDLSSTFDRALSKISDTRYGSSIFALVAAALRPLMAEELRIALNIEPGQPEWDPTTLPHASASIVGLCGGGLLEVEEESQEVCFIHFSALQHLLESPKVSSVPAFHFTRDEAAIDLGSRCVTYLSYPLFERQVAVNRAPTIYGQQVAHRVTESVLSPTTVTGRFVSGTLRSFGLLGTGQAQELDIGATMERYLQRKKDSDEVYIFQEYAQSHWLEHSKLLYQASSNSSYRLLRKLLGGSNTFVNRPWLGDEHPINPLIWAAKNGHGTVFRWILEEEVQIMESLGALQELILNNPAEINLDNVHLMPLWEVIVKTMPNSRHDHHWHWSQTLLQYLSDRHVPLEDTAASDDPRHSILAKAIHNMDSLSERDLGVMHFLLDAKANPLGGLLAAIKASWVECIGELLVVAHQWELSHDAALRFEPELTKIPSDFYKEKDDEDYFTELLRYLSQHTETMGSVIRKQPCVLTFVVGLGEMELAASLLRYSLPIPFEALNNTLKAVVEIEGPEVEGQQALIHDLLEAGADANICFDTPEAIPALSSFAEDTWQLLAAKLHHSIRIGPDRNPVLNIACQFAPVHVIQSFLKRGASPNIGSSSGLTPLYFAVASQNEELVRVLLEAGANPRVCSKDGKTPMSEAISKCNLPIMDLLQSYGAQVKTTMLNLACQGAPIHIARGFLKRGADPNICSCNELTPLHHAVVSQNEELVRVLLEADADPNAYSKDGKTPLTETIIRCNLAIMDLLLSHGARVEIHSLEKACSLLISENGLRWQLAVTKLVDRIESVKGIEPIYLLTLPNLSDYAVSKFIEKGLDVTWPDFAQSTESHPLVTAASRGLGSAMTTIIGACKPRILDRALWAAVLSKTESQGPDDPRVMKKDKVWRARLLLEHGANPNMRANDFMQDEELEQDSLLYTALRVGPPGVAVALLEAGASPDLWARLELQSRNIPWQPPDT